jgi:hypothetical protein
MVKFVVVMIKSKKRPVVENGQLSEAAEILHWEHQEAEINNYLMRGYEIVHTIDLEDLRGVYILFVLQKRARNS